MTMKEVLINAADITHVHPLSKACVLQFNHGSPANNLFGLIFS
jgi:hypothetical protein